MEVDLGFDGVPAPVLHVLPPPDAEAGGLGCSLRVGEALHHDVPNGRLLQGTHSGTHRDPDTFLALVQHLHFVDSQRLRSTAGYRDGVELGAQVVEYPAVAGFEVSPLEWRVLIEECKCVRCKNI